MGERLVLATAPAAPGTREYLPDHGAERRHDHDVTTPAVRVVQAISLSRTATRIAAAARTARDAG